MYHNEKTDAAFPELRSQRELDRRYPEGLVPAAIAAICLIAVVAAGVVSAAVIVLDYLI